MKSSLKLFYTRLFFYLLMLYFFSCNTNSKKGLQETEELVEKYSNMKYSLATDSVSDNQIDAYFTKSEAILVKKTASIFKSGMESIGLIPIGYSVNSSIDSTREQGDTVLTFFRENVKIKYLLRDKTGDDTMQSIYENRLIAKIIDSKISSITNISDDPLFFTATPTILKISNPAPASTKSNAPPRPSFAYDRQAAIKYAYQFWQTPNPAYCNYDGVGGDCTNFLSQCLNSGGWVMRNDWKAQGAGCCDNILTCSIQNCYTCTWTVAHEFYQWVLASGRIEPVSYNLSDLEIGDIIQQDYPSDGHIDHSMIVTKKQGNIIFVTYRSAGVGTAQKDVPANQIRGSLYCWHAKDKFN